MKDYIFHYIPRCMTSLWSTDGESVEVLTDNNNTYRCDISTLFTENLVLDTPLEIAQGGDYYESAKLEELIGAVNSGKDEIVLINEREVYKLFIYLLYTGKFSLCRFRNIVMSMHSEKRFKSEQKLMEEVERVANEKRKTSSLISSRLLSEFMMPYLYDLKTAILDVPEGMSFVIGDNPLLTFFFFNEEAIHLLNGPINCNGVIFILPVSPGRAICIYDGFVYKIRKNQGRTVLNEDDVDVINYGVMKLSGNIVIKRTEKCDIGHFNSLRNECGTPNLDTYEFSFINIIQRSESVKGKHYRPYAERLMIYDGQGKTESGRKEFIERILSQKDY